MQFRRGIGVARHSAMQHRVFRTGSQMGLLEGVIGSMLLTSKLIDKNFTVTTWVVRPNLLTLVLITDDRGAA